MLTSRIYGWADRAPDKVALIQNGESFTYAAFASYIARARAFYLRRQIVGPGVAVVLTVNRLDHWIMSLALRGLGLDTVGVAEVDAIAPLGLGDVRIVTATADGVTPALTALCAAQGWPLLGLRLVGEPGMHPSEGFQPEREGGAILTTSGTTGVRKKILMDPAFEAEFFRIRRDQAGVSADSIVSVCNFEPSTGVGYKSPASTWDIGGTVLMHYGLDQHVALLYPGLTHATLTPLLVALINKVPLEVFTQPRGARVQIGGGPIGEAALAELKARLGPNIHSVISATETSTFASTLLEAAEDRRWHRPVPGRDVQLVDEMDRPTPIGEVGRIRVSTMGGPNAYMDDAAATRAFFRDGYFYPGDLAIMRADGRISLQGRVTDVINIAGDKISPAPVEEELQARLGVPGVCLFSMQNDAAEEQLNVVVEDAPGLTKALLVKELSAMFGAYFNDLRYFVVPSLPRNAMGKLLRQEVRQSILTRTARDKG
jgi:non-ribosomal peptide synthetase component E (peptide arylation enzyme)